MQKLKKNHDLSIWPDDLDRLAGSSLREACTSALKSTDRPSKGEPDRRTVFLQQREQFARSAVSIMRDFHAYVSPSVFLRTRHIRVANAIASPPFHPFISCRDTSMQNDIRHGTSFV